jgi:hypothetical protein
VERPLRRLLPDPLQARRHVDRKIDLPVSQPTSCCFGGPDLTTLYVTSARHGLDDAAIAQNPTRGRRAGDRDRGQGHAVDPLRRLILITGCRHDWPDQLDL